MKTLSKYLSIFLLVFFYCFSVNAQQDFTMQIVLDKPVDAGPLKLFPGVKDKDSYWYTPNKLRLAKNDDGTPKMKFVKWVHNEENNTNEGIGGGVLHCVYGFGVTEEELDEAEKALKKINSRGKIVGSVIYKEGTVTVSIPKLMDPEAQEIVAMAPAPTMEGNYVAVNMQLDKRSASLLWDSFKTGNSLVTFNFNMTIAGYNSPIEAKIKIHTDQIYDSQQFKAGLATPWLNAEIDVLVKELIDNGSIEIEKIGDNFSMQAAIDKVVEKATDLLFTPFGSSQGPSISQLTSAANSQGNESLLTRATNLLNTSRTEARTERDAVRRRNAERERVAREERERAASTDETDSDSDSDSDVASTDATDGDLRPEQSGGLTPGDSQRAVNGTTPSNNASNLEEEPNMPSIAIVASYTVKKIKISGTKTFSLKESYPTTIPSPFGGDLEVNMTSCPKCFIETNLDDPVFKQREILALLDGLNANDFDKYINYGTVQLRKKHESEAFTYDEVRITRKNFNQDGNLFTMLYGWKGDNNRSKWFDYDYKIAWSFFGGNNIETDWESTNRSAINLSPPLTRRVITIEADKDLLDEQRVRAIDIKIYYNLGGDDQMKQFSLNPKKDVLSGQVEFMLPNGSQEYDYEVTWRLWGNEQKTSGRQTTSFETLYVDELPN
ncbi:hypothetical protein [Flavivirga spongiicola]|uniref:Uncharacterized protein n=1 Tax=Flavivirga spongiicola TaxID=421621 RepID=A0ABU7XM40_9FLAO|nr:hypothetical protein [Flavivirga sp. MEBiC05379]MDO5981477.1 hypothetical protein [Flavivirga sp. MEBiC05379]